MSSPSEGEDDEGRAADNPAVVMTDESTGNRYMRLVDSKGLSENKADPWLVKDLHAELKSWGRPGGGDNKLVIKSAGESPIVAVREALARKHGGIISPEQPPKGEHASNGVIEESGKTIRDGKSAEATTGDQTRQNAKHEGAHNALVSAVVSDGIVEIPSRQGP